MPTVLLTLYGCHVLDGLEIPCAADEACAGGGTDSGTDTGPVDGPTVGWIVAYASSSKQAIRAYDPGGSAFLEWDDAPGTGPVAWSAESGGGSLVTGGYVHGLGGDGTVTVAAAVPVGETTDIERDGSTLYLAVGTNLLQYQVEGEVWDAVFEDERTALAHLALVDSDLYAADETSRGITLFRFQRDGGETVTAASGFDPVRGRNVFTGPDGEAYSCSAAGAVYRVADLEAGRATVTAWYDVGVDDVTDCAWDQGDASWLLHSRSLGVVRLGSDGVGTPLSPPPDGFSADRANFFLY